MLRILKTGLKSLFVLGFFGLIGVYVVAAVEAPPPLDVAALKARAKLYDADIKRDEWGVPHIYGKRDEDVAFGFAYAHSEDDFRTIEETAIAVRGQLASIKGKDAAVTDYLVHLMHIWETVNARYETDLSPKLRHVLEAYAD